MLRILLTTATLSACLFTQSALAARSPFKKNVRAANKAVVALVDSTSGDVLTLATTVAEDTIVTKASEIADIPPENLRVRHAGLLEVTDSWTDSKNDLSILRVDGELPPPVQLSAVGNLPQGRILATVTGGKNPAKAGTVSVAAREIEMRNGVLGIQMESFRGRRNYPVIISEVFPGGGAEAAGLLPGDTILSIDDKGLGNSRQLQDVVFAKLPGEVVKLRILREDREFDQDVKLAHMTVLDPVDFLRNRNLQISGPISKRVSGFTNAIQHDIALTPQQMGTPVLDTSGEIVAINIARADRLSTYALPAAMVRTAIDNAAAAATPPPAEADPTPQPVEPEPTPEPASEPEEG